MLCESPAATATTPVSPLGTVHWPKSSKPQPQATTVPSLFTARLLPGPAAIAVTPERPLGTLHCPESAYCPMQPHATTVPLAVARACPVPPGTSSPRLSTAIAASRRHDLALVPGVIFLPFAPFSACGRHKARTANEESRPPIMVLTLDRDARAEITGFSDPAV